MLYDITRDGLTQGAIATWRTCPEKARLKLHEGLGSVYYKEALEFGNVVHGNLEYVYSQFWDLQQQRGKTMSVGELMGLSLDYLDLQELTAHKELAASIAPASEADNIELLYKQAAVILQNYF